MERIQRSLLTKYIVDFKKWNVYFKMRKFFSCVCPAYPQPFAKGRENNKLKGSTLVETLVAMIIVMLAFGIGLLIYLNVIQSSGAQQKLNAQLQMNKIAIETKDKNLFVDEEDTTGTMKIIKTIQPYSAGSDKLKLLKIEAFDGNGKKLAEREELIIHTPTN